VGRACSIMGNFICFLQIAQFINVKVKLSLCLIKHYAMKICWGAEV
jgi:hypothetical protein